jgi:hypothetical protein
VAERSSNIMPRVTLMHGHHMMHHSPRMCTTPHDMVNYVSIIDVAYLGRSNGVGSTYTPNIYQMESFTRRLILFQRCGIHVRLTPSFFSLPVAFSPFLLSATKSGHFSNQTLYICVRYILLLVHDVPLYLECPRDAPPNQIGGTHS